MTWGCHNFCLPLALGEAVVTQCKSTYLVAILVSHTSSQVVRLRSSEAIQVLGGVWTTHMAKKSLPKVVQFWWDSDQDCGISITITFNSCKYTKASFFRFLETQAYKENTLQQGRQRLTWKGQSSPLVHDIATSLLFGKCGTYLTEVFIGMSSLGKDALKIAKGLNQLLKEDSPFRNLMVGRRCSLKQYSPSFYVVLLGDMSDAIEERKRLSLTFWSGSERLTKETRVVLLVLRKRLPFSNKHNYNWEMGDDSLSESARLNYVWGNISQPPWLNT